jgi:hypothetical protein
MQLIRGRMEHWRKEPKDRNPLPAADYVIANLDWALSNLDDVGWELESALRAVPPQKHEEKEHEGLPGTPGQGNPLEPTPRREVCGRCGKEHCENTKDTRDGFTDPDYGL